MVNSTSGYEDLPTRPTQQDRGSYEYPIPQSERPPALPLAVGAVNIQDSLEVKGNSAQAMALGAAGNKIEGWVENVVVAQAVNPMEIVPRGTELEREAIECLQSATPDQSPAAMAVRTSAVEQYRTSENVASGIDPHAAGDKLEGYVPRFFLKEDGKHDDTH
jgi:hypothetical protein